MIRVTLQFFIQCDLTESQMSHRKHNMYTKILLFGRRIISAQMRNYKNNVKK